MKSYLKYSIALGLILFSMIFSNGCEDYLNPEQDLDVTEDKLLNDYFEYRSLEMGLYALQQNLVEQLIILGELRADLLNVTPYADVDLVEINNFNISKTNKYADPTNFFKLISASNNFIYLLKKNHPEVLNPASEVTNYDRMYGEALCMRAWAYFNAARIYGKIPVIHESLKTYEEIENYINSPGVYIDSVHIEYSTDGYYNDTTYNHEIILEKKFYDLDMVIDLFTTQLEKEVKAVGVNHYLDNNDITWEISIWNNYAMNTLIGQMYLTSGNLQKADLFFSKVVMSESVRYQLTSFLNSSWKTIFSSVNNFEHIYIILFSKGNQQQNLLQQFFEPFGPYNYQLKPTGSAIKKWETTWKGQNISRNDINPSTSFVENPGVPGDQHRGANVSYAYFKGDEILRSQLVDSMLLFKSKGDYRSVESIMDGYDTMVYKYSIGKNLYDEDANFQLYRASSVQLYRAEIYTYYYFPDASGVVKPFLNNAINIVNDGSNYSDMPTRVQKGVRGRVGLGSGDDKIEVNNIEYLKDPYTNTITGYIDVSGNFAKKQNLLEDKIMDERARELAFEGERFYDLMRVAKRRNDPSYLASRVSVKFPPGQREQIYTYLMDEQNWYIRIFE